MGAAAVALGMTAGETFTLFATVAALAASAYQQEQQGEFQKKVQQRNADAEEKAARDAEARGLNEGVNAGLVGGAQRGAIRAEFGASGLDVGSGSALDVLSDVAMMTELNKRTAQANASREADFHRLRAGDYLAQGELSRRRGSYDAFGTVLGGSASVYGNYLRFTS